MYTYIKIDKKLEDRCCKGTEKCVVTESLTFDDYKASLFEGETRYRENSLFENKKHEVCPLNKHNIALKEDDNKRRVEEDGVTTLSRSHLA